MSTPNLCPCGSGLPREDCEPGELLLCRFDGEPAHYFHRRFPRHEYCAGHDKNARRRQATVLAAREREETLLASAARLPAQTTAQGRPNQLDIT